MERRALEEAWTHESWMTIGGALLEADRPLTAGEIAAATGKDQSNTRRAAQAMTEAGLLEERPCVRRPSTPGRKAKSEFALKPGPAAALARALADAVAPGQLRRGQQLVFAQTDGLGLLRMNDALAEAGFGARGSWSAMCDGDAHEYVMVFDGDDAARAAVDLMAMLTAAEVRCRRVSVADILPAHGLTAWARETAARERRLRIRRDTRRAANG